MPKRQRLKPPVRQLHNRIRRDADGFIYVENVKLFRVSERDTIEVLDKDRRTASQRGSRFVEIDLGEFVRFLENVE